MGKRPSAMAQRNHVTSRHAKPFPFALPTSLAGLAVMALMLSLALALATPCHAQAMWSEWTSSGPCSATCGDASQSFVRQCTGAGTCDGENSGAFQSKTDTCEDMLPCCPVDSAWSEWGEWSDCSVTCESGVRTRERVCEAEMCGGTPGCDGDDVGDEQSQTEVCDTNQCCPGVGDWIYTQWSDWSSNCGTRMRTRSTVECDAPCQGTCPTPVISQSDFVDCSVTSTPAPTTTMVVYTVLSFFFDVVGVTESWTNSMMTDVNTFLRQQYNIELGASLASVYTVTADRVTGGTFNVTVSILPPRSATNWFCAAFSLLTAPEAVTSLRSFRSEFRNANVTTPANVVGCPGCTCSSFVSQRSAEAASSTPIVPIVVPVIVGLIIIVAIILIFVKRKSDRSRANKVDPYPSLNQSQHPMLRDDRSELSSLMSTDITHRTQLNPLFDPKGPHYGHGRPSMINNAMYDIDQSLMASPEYNRSRRRELQQSDRLEPGAVLFEDQSRGMLALVRKEAGVYVRAEPMAPGLMASARHAIIVKKPRGGYVLLRCSEAGEFKAARTADSEDEVMVVNTLMGKPILLFRTKRGDMHTVTDFDRIDIGAVMDPAMAAGAARVLVISQQPEGDDLLYYQLKRESNVRFTVTYPEETQRDVDTVEAELVASPKKMLLTRLTDGTYVRSSKDAAGSRKALRGFSLALPSSAFREVLTQVVTDEILNDRKKLVTLLQQERMFSQYVVLEKEKGGNYARAALGDGKGDLGPARMTVELADGQVLDLHRTDDGYTDVDDDKPENPSDIYSEVKSTRDDHNGYITLVRSENGVYAVLAKNDDEVTYTRADSGADYMSAEELRGRSQASSLAHVSLGRHSSSTPLPGTADARKQSSLSSTGFLPPPADDLEPPVRGFDPRATFDNAIVSGRRDSVSSSPSSSPEVDAQDDFDHPYQQRRPGDGSRYNRRSNSISSNNTHGGYDTIGTDVLFGATSTRNNGEEGARKAGKSSTGDSSWASDYLTRSEAMAGPSKRSSRANAATVAPLDIDRSDKGRPAPVRSSLQPPRTATTETASNPINERANERASDNPRPDSRERRRSRDAQPPGGRRRSSDYASNVDYERRVRDRETLDAIIYGAPLGTAEGRTSFGESRTSADYGAGRRRSGPRPSYGYITVDANANAGLEGIEFEPSQRRETTWDQNEDPQLLTTAQPSTQVKRAKSPPPSEQKPDATQPPQPPQPPQPSKHRTQGQSPSRAPTTAKAPAPATTAAKKNGKKKTLPPLNLTPQKRGPRHQQQQQQQQGQEGKQQPRAGRPNRGSKAPKQVMFESRYSVISEDPAEEAEQVPLPQNRSAMQPQQPAVSRTTAALKDDNSTQSELMKRRQKRQSVRPARRTSAQKPIKAVEIGMISAQQILRDASVSVGSYVLQVATDTTIWVHIALGGGVQPRLVQVTVDSAEPKVKLVNQDEFVAPSLADFVELYSSPSHPPNLSITLTDNLTPL